MISKVYGQTTLDLSKVQALEQERKFMLLPHNKNDYGMKIHYKEATNMFGAVAIENLTIGETYTLNVYIDELVSNIFKIYVNETAHDNSNPVAEHGYTEGKATLSFVATAESMFVAIGDEDASQDTYIIVDYASVMHDNVESINNPDFGDGTTDYWFSQNNEAELDIYEYSSAPPSDGPEDPVPTGIVYYFAEDGDDSNDGLTPANPKKSISELNNIIPTLSAGDGILFAMGDKFIAESGEVIDHSDLHGTETDPIVFSRYWKEGDESNTTLPLISSERTATLSFTDLGGGIWENNSVAMQSSQLRLLKDGTEVLKVDNEEHFYNYSDAGFVYTDTGILHRSDTDPNGTEWTYTNIWDFITLTNCSHMVINGIEIRWAGYTTLTLNGCTYIEIQNNQIAGYSYRGLFIQAGNNEGVNLRYNIFDTLFRLDYSSLDYLESGDHAGIHNMVVYIEGSNNAVVEHCNFIDYGHCGLMFYSGTHTNPKVLHCTFSAPHSNYSRPFECDGTDGGIIGLEWAYCTIEKSTVQSQVSGVNNHIHHNIFKEYTHCTQYVVDIIHDKGKSIAESSGYKSNWIIENNIFYDFENVSFQAPHSTAKHTIRNNIFMKVGQDLTDEGGTQVGLGIWLMMWDTGDPTGTELEIYNNLFYDENLNPNQNVVATGNEVNDVQYKFTVAELNDDTTHNWVTVDNLADNPNFVDITEFRLQSGSPAIGSGAQPLATIDRDGNTITAPYNIGLYNTNE